MKLTRFSQIEKMTPHSSYRVHSDWKYLKSTIDRYCNEIGTAQLDLNPDFQRGHIWTEAQQIAYVEYVLKGGMSGKDIYMNCVGWSNDYRGPFVLVDGKQRLEAALKFLNNKLRVFGSLYSEFTDRLPSEAMFIININNLDSRAKVLKWYLEMNSGGTPHTDAELNRVAALLQEEYKKI